MSDAPKSFFTSLTGILTGLASLIVAITGLYAATDGFNFSRSAKTEVINQPTVDHSAQEHQRQIEALKRQQELDELRIAQEKKRLLAEQELADIKARKQAQALAQTTLPASTPAYVPSIAQVAGSWVFSNIIGTYTFVIEQDGNNLTIQEFDAAGTNLGHGTGKIDGRQVYLNWVEAYLIVLTIDVEAHLTLGSDGTTLIGNMYVDGNTVPISLYKR